MGTTGTVDIEIIALSLASTEPFVVSFNGGATTQLWSVAVGLSETDPQDLGTLTAEKTHLNGGTFDATRG